MKALNLVLLMVFCFIGSVSAQDAYPFEHKKQAQRFHQLNQSLRCIECQGQSVAESFTRLANDVKRFNHQAILQGKSDEDIIAFLTQRYGAHIYAKPHHTGGVRLLWFAPVLFLFGALCLVWFTYIKTNKIQ